jgi:hypothetical protein
MELLVSQLPHRAREPVTGAAADAILRCGQRGWKSVVSLQRFAGRARAGLALAD